MGEFLDFVFFGNSINSVALSKIVYKKIIRVCFR